MAGPFFERLQDYYLKVAAVLRGEAAAAAIFPNSTDIGSSREQVYRKFLCQHTPSKCNVFPGGFLFDDEGVESSQLDLIVTTDTTPRFDLYKDGHGKSFAHVEGTLGVISIKSTLDKNRLEESLTEFASIPPTRSLEGRKNPMVTIDDYDDWPLKVLYATDGNSHETIRGHIFNFYSQRPEIPIGRRPNLIHVCGKYVLARLTKGMAAWDANSKNRLANVEPGAFLPVVINSDLQALVWTIDGLQHRAAASTHIVFTYRKLINSVLGLPNQSTDDPK